ncbi:glycine zipper 2TM domain-containing protein [Stenotrophomonas sp. YIM B06876]|uniref:glycine zipper 2TM domain-containing protein n=1 Tax=Stenotrophomonas sp. YIM B06876 TaxID=3060211 RepID=UPI00273A2EC5|nr:glycine zipper 2TM domain-containing protein [Stenotrophomonas sp. YIM B06876]
MSNISALSFRGLAMALALTAGLATVSDASAMSKKDKHTVVGAVVGGVAGHLISNGDPAATIGGAVAGGAIGNLTTRDNHSHRYDHRHDYRRGHGHHHDRRDRQRRHGRGW